MVRKVNKSLKDWVSFVKKVKAEEGISYPDAMKRAKVRKDSGEKWMSGGAEVNPPGTPDSIKVPDNVLANPKNIDNELVKNQGGVSSSTSTVLGARGGSKKQKTAKKQQKSAKKQKGGRRKTCSKK
jgi:hypothetical protein